MALKKITSGVFFLVFGIAFSLVVMEVLLKLFWHPPFLDPKYKRDDIAWMSKNVILNSYGYRDDEIATDGQNKTRVYSLGDSYTFGWYINDYNATYPQLLEHQSKDLEVINASRPGFSLKESIERLDSEGLSFAPDIVTLGINIYDVEGGNIPSSIKSPKFLSDLRIYQLLIGNLQRQKLAQRAKSRLISSTASGSSELEQFKQTISLFKANAHKIGATPLLIIFPAFDLSNPNGQYLFNSFHDEVKKIATSEGVMSLDLLEYFAARPDKKELILNPLDAHPSEAAHKLAGESLAQFIVKNNLQGLKEKNKLPQKLEKYKLGDTIKNLVTIIKTPGTVYFDRKNDLAVQKRTFKIEKSEVPYLPDIIKTAKALTHDGWVGAKAEVHFTGGKEIEVPLVINNQKVVGISEIVGFFKTDNSLESKNISISEVSIEEKADQLLVKIDSQENYDLYKVTLDLESTQFEIEENKIAAIYNTKILETDIKKGQSKVFIEIKNLENYGSPPRYVWSENKMKIATIKKAENGFWVELLIKAESDQKIKFPIMTKIEDNLPDISIVYI